MTATSEQSQRPSWKGGVQSAHPGPQEAPVCLPQRQHGEGRKSPLHEHPSFDHCLCHRLKMQQPPVLQGVHLNMIKQPLGLCGWEMEIYRLPNLHLNANAVSSP